MSLSKYKKIRLTTFAGVPIYMGWSLYPVLALVLVGMFTDISFLLGALSWWGVLLLHELGHMWAARRNRLRVMGIELHLLHGLCWYEESGVPYENYLVAWGGVFFQFLVAIPCFVLWGTLGDKVPWYLATPILFFGPISLFIAVINLAPSAGLDGETCWKAIPLYLKIRKSKRKENFSKW